MPPLLAKDRFSGRRERSARLPEELCRRARRTLAHMCGQESAHLLSAHLLSVHLFVPCLSVRRQYALKVLRQLSPERRTQRAAAHAFARHLAIGVAVDRNGAIVAAAKVPRRYRDCPGAAARTLG